MKQLKKTLLTLVALLAVTTGAWADEVKNPIVYDFEAAANAGENPDNKNGSAANGQQFYGWENDVDKKDKARQDYKGYEYAEGSKLPEVCHVWRRSDRINGNVSGNGGLKCPSNKEMAVDGLKPGNTVTIIYDATGAADDSKELVWAIGDGSSESLGEPRAKAIINGAEAVPGTTTIKSGDVITVTKVTPAANGSGYIVFAVKKNMVIKKIIIDEAPTATPVALTRGTGDKINEWTLTNKMPAGNVTVTAEYFPQATAAEGALTAATGVAATTSEPLVTLDASKLTGATKLMYLASTDATKPAYDAQGWSDKVPTADSFTEAGNVNVWYYPVGTDDEDPAKTFSDGDICATALTVSLAAAPTYSVTFAEDNPEPDKWSASPNTGLTKGTEVTVTYSGTRKVIGVKAEKILDMRSTPLTVEALTAGIVTVNSPNSGMQYSLNGGAKTAMSGKTEIPVQAGDQVAFYGNITQYLGTRIGGSGDGFQVKVYGNIMSLVDETGFATAMTLTVDFAFNSLFKSNTTITDISNLVLPATELSQGCYGGMFSGCTGLTALPADLLPATTLALSCYGSMFNGCTGLTTLPANFLPATKLAESCYGSMFYDCKGLTTVPADLLPATTLAQSCYNYMFEECSNLTAAPDLPAPALVDQCYGRMFHSCSKLASITCRATSGINTDNSTADWVTGVAATGTFNAVSTATWPTGTSGIPDGWSRVNIDN